jgi:hypothetical protein
MSHAHGPAFGWRFWSALLLIVPTVFVTGALTGHTPAWGLLQNPAVLLFATASFDFGNASIGAIKPPSPRSNQTLAMPA